MDEKKTYEESEVLKQIVNELKGRKFLLDCGHKVTFGYFLGNSIKIINGKDLRIVCWQCY